MSSDPVRASEGIGPMKGVKILDLTRFLNGPSATRVLADYGATVIKVEQPGKGDEARAGGRLTDGYNTFKEYYNRGKMSLSLDLKNPASRPVMKKLVEWADVLTENYKPGTIASYGYGYEQLKEWNPNLIYCTNSGFGDKGPLGKHGSFDFVAQAFTGVMHAQGGGPSRRPQPVIAGGLSDEVGAMSFVQGILMALIARKKTGKAQRMDTSQTGATIQFQQSTMAPALHMETQRDNGSIGSPKWMANTYQGSDKKWFIVQPRNFPKMLRAVGREDMAKDDRLKDNRSRTKNQDWVEAELQKTFSAQTREYWLDLLGKEGEPAGPVHNYKELMNHEQVWANGYLEKMPYEKLGNVPGAKKEGEVVAAKAFRFQEQPAGPVATGPAVGEHTDEVLKNVLGFGQAEIDALAQAGSTTAKTRKAAL